MATRKRLLGLLVPVLVVMSVGVARPAAAGSMTCYSTSQDGDGDGYAAGDASGVSDNNGNTLHCDAGYVDKDGDCDNTIAAVHPRRTEITGNGRDDDCSNGVDEADAVYSPFGYNVTTSSFTVKYRLASSAVIATRDTFLAATTAMPLDGSAPVTATRHPSSVAQNSAGEWFAEVPITGLKATTVYKVTTSFKDSAGRVLGGADAYYSTTDGTTGKSLARTRMVLRAFDEYGLSTHGAVGYRGLYKTDGQRYLADYNELWCSEFYVFNSHDEIGTDGLSSVKGLENYFKAFDDGSYTDAAAIRTWADRGDYASFGSTTNHHHSTMVLARSGDDLWTIEGNVSNEIRIQKRTVGASGESLRFLGHVTYEMLD